MKGIMSCVLVNPLAVVDHPFSLTAAWLVRIISSSAESMLPSSPSKMLMIFTGEI